MATRGESSQAYLSLSLEEINLVIYVLEEMIAGSSRRAGAKARTLKKLKLARDRLLGGSKNGS